MTRKYPKFCDPTNDWAFKRIFGSEQYKAATIGFINSMLPGAPEFFFLEPKRFRKKENELQTYQEKWLFLLRNAKSLSVIPATFAGDKAFDAYFSASETANLTKEERILYDQAMITKTDIEYGKLYSYKKGLAKGEAKGRKETQKELAKKMLLKGMSVQDISDLTGISAEDLEKLKN